MKICSTARVGLLCALVALAAAGSARAQDVQPPDQGGGIGGVLQPFRGLFGGNEPNPNASETLDLSASLYGGYDSNIGASLTGQPSVTKGGSPYWGSAVTLTYLHDGPRWDVGTSVSGDGHWYSDYPDMNGVGAGYAVGATYAQSTRTQITVAQSLQYSPYYTFGSLFAVVAPPGLGQLPGYVPGLTVLNVETLNVGAQAGLTHATSPRGKLEFQYSFNYTDFQTELWSNVASNYVGGRYRHRLSDYLGLRAGYAYNWANYSRVADYTYTNQIIDAGVDYNRSLRLSRRTIFGFSVGSTVVSNAFPGSSDDDVWFGLVGSANLQHGFLRSWFTGIAYSRNVNYTPGFTAPVFADSVGANLTGYLTDRLRSSTAVGVSHGTVGFAAGKNTYTTTSAYTELQYALSEKLATSIRYYYYYYDFANRAYLPIGVAQNLSRNGVEASLTVWLPVLAK